MKQLTVEFLIVNNCRTDVWVPDYFSSEDPDPDYIINEINRNVTNEKFETLDEETIKIRQVFPHEDDSSNGKEIVKPLTNEEIFDMLYVEEWDNDSPDYVSNEDSMFIEIE